jgi:hypothetical protein
MSVQKVPQVQGISFEMAPGNMAVGSTPASAAAARSGTAISIIKDGNLRAVPLVRERLER